MPDRLHALTPDALVMMDTIARSGSFAAAALQVFDRWVDDGLIARPAATGLAVA